MRNTLRPYVAVIVDSFREALATRVLWAVLLLIGLLLAALAPFTFHEATAVTVRSEDFIDSRGLLLHLREQRDAADTPAGYVWSRLSPLLQQDIARISVDSDHRERMAAFGKLRRELNALLHQRDFYRAGIWRNHRLNREGRDLLKQGIASLSENDLARLNRLALDAAFPGFLEPAATSAVQFEYAGYDLGDELPLSDDQVRQFGELILAGAVSWLVGFFGILAALVVTASIVPRMLEPGSIDLLLSKPVSRWGLFLSRFAGGCAFILLVTSVLICGLWLIVGTRLGIWNAGLLWTIPVFVFVFAVYFSVSTLAGVLWRNPIVSIIVSLVFWVVCFGVGLTKAIVDDVFLSARRPAVLLPLADSLLVIRRNGNGCEWDPDSRSWQTLFEQRRRGPGSRFPFLGPVYDAASDRLVAIRTSNGGPPWMRGAPKLALATRDSDWKFSTPVNVPGGAQQLVVLPGGTILTVGSGGLYELTRPDAPRGLLDVLSLAVPILSNSDPDVGRFRRIEIPDLQWHLPLAAAAERTTPQPPRQTPSPAGSLLASSPAPRNTARHDTPPQNTAPDGAPADDLTGSHPADRHPAEVPAGTEQPDDASAPDRTADVTGSAERFAVVSGATIAILHRDRDGRFTLERQATRDSAVRSIIGFSGHRIVLAEEGGRIRILDTRNLSEVATASPFGRNDPQSLAMSPDGRQAAVVFHHRRLCLIDLPSGAVTVPALAPQGDLSAVAYGPDGSLLVGFGFGEVIEYTDGRALTVKARYQTPPDLLESVYQWGIDPLHTIFPKPGEMDNLVAWLMTREQTIPAGNPDTLSASRTVIDIWPPLWSNLAFLAVMLTASCILISRRDF